MRFLVSAASLCLPLSSYLHLSHLSAPIFHFPSLLSEVFNCNLVLCAFVSLLTCSFLPRLVPTSVLPHLLQTGCSPTAALLSAPSSPTTGGLLQHAWRWCTCTEWESVPSPGHFSAFSPSVMKISQRTQWVVMTFRQRCLFASVAHCVVKQARPGPATNQTTTTTTASLFLHTPLSAPIGIATQRWHKGDNWKTAATTKAPQYCDYMALSR